MAMQGVCAGSGQLVIEKQAAFWRRAAAYLLDGVLLIVFGIAAMGFWLWKMSGGGWGKTDAVIWVDFSWSETVPAVCCFIVLLAVVCAVELWLTNGYTLGKRLLHIRVRRMDGQRITLGNVLVREIMIKGVLNGLTLGLLGIVSLGWAAVGSLHQTVQDRLAATQVVSIGVWEK